MFQKLKAGIVYLRSSDTFEHDYPFYYRSPFKVLDDGWTQFDVEQWLFPRLQLHASDRWRISSVNVDFQV
jgi:hypothetical protein